MRTKAIRTPFRQHERSVLFTRITIALGSLALGRLVRPLTSRMLLRAFCTPTVRLNPNEAQRSILDAGERFTWRVGASEATGWRWGRGPAILLAHGWAGRASQFTSWVPELTRRGYSVIALDQPAHGESPGSSTHAVEMKEMILALAERTGPLAGVVAHSLGGLVASYALSQGMETGAMILISSPPAPGPFFERLMKMVRLPWTRHAAVRRGAEAIFGGTFEEVALRNSWRGNRTPVLLVHDRTDRQVPFAALDEIRRALPHAEIHATEGLGHNRILKDSAVVTLGADFIEFHAADTQTRPLPSGFAHRMSAVGIEEEALISIDEVMADLAFGRS